MRRGDSLTAIAANITADATLAAAGISATIVADGAGFRLRINDSGGENFHMTDTSSLVSTLNVKVHDAGIMAQVAIRSDIVNDPSLVSRGTFNNSGTLLVGDTGLTTGDKSSVQAIANRSTPSCPTTPPASWRPARRPFRNTRRKSCRSIPRRPIPPQKT